MVSSEGIIDPSIDTLMSKVDSKYALVTFAAQRARQINDYYSALHDGNLLDNVGPLTDASVDDKPLTVALHEIAENKLHLIPGDKLGAELPEVTETGETEAAEAAAPAEAAESTEAAEAAAESAETN